MKSFLATMMLCFFAVSVFGQYLIDQNEAERMRKNNVEKKIDWEYSYKDGKLNPKGFKASVTTYDKQGNTLEKINYRYNGDIGSKYTYKYDGAGNRIEYMRYDGRRGEYTMKTYTKYDKQGNKVAEQGLSGSSGPYRNYYKYNVQGDLTEIHYYSDQILTEKRIIEHSKNSRVIKIYEGGSVFTGKIVKEFDSSGNLLSEIRYSPAGKEIRKFTYKYDAQDNMTQEVKIYGGTMRQKKDYEYNPDDKLIKVTYTLRDGSSFVNNLYTYDNMGRLVEEKWYNQANDDYSVKKYSYNPKGDLIQAKCYYAQFGTRYLYRYEYERF